MKFNTKSLSMTGLMAALCFVGTTFLMFQIPSPLGNTRFHLGDVFCLLAGLLFGPLTGGMAGSIGMSLSDLVTGYAIYAPSTFVLRLIQGFLCGWIAWRGVTSGERKAPSPVRSSVACAVATTVYIILYLVYHFFEKRYLWKVEHNTVLIDMAMRLGTSSFKAVINILIAITFAPVIRSALKRAGFDAAR